MKKIYFLLVLFGALLFCACEKENIDPMVEDQAQSQTQESALKGAKKGMTKDDLTPWPMVARMGAGAEYIIPATDEYGVIIFYVNDPFAFKDHNFYHPFGFGWYVEEARSLDKEDFSVEGSSWWLPDYEMAPHHYHAKGKGDVLVWIITIDQVHQLYNNALTSTGELTIDDIAALNSPKPLVGHATSYNEVLRPGGGGAPILGGTFNAHGTLETWDGEDIGKFIYTSKTKLKPGEDMTSNNKLQIIYK